MASTPEKDKAFHRQKLKYHYHSQGEKDIRVSNGHVIYWKCSGKTPQHWRIEKDTRARGLSLQKGSHICIFLKDFISLIISSDQTTPKTVCDIQIISISKSFISYLTKLWWQKGEGEKKKTWLCLFAQMSKHNYFKQWLTKPSQRSSP